MQRPSKPIGKFYSAAEAQQLMSEQGWTMMEDAGRGWRRIVASPAPRSIVESAVIEQMVQAGIIVISSGGGGVPVMISEQGDLVGVEAVIDKDLASSLLASTLHADLLLISTGVEKVALYYGTPQQRDLGEMTLSDARHYLAEGHFAKGSMEPKIRAAIEYLERGGQSVLITLPESISRALAGETGTWIVPDGVVNQRYAQGKAALIQ